MVRILPRSQRNVVGFECIDTVTLKDYQEILIPAFNRAIAEHGKIRGLFDFTAGFVGFELKAILKDFRYSFSHLHQFEKFAVINAPKWVTVLFRIANAVTKCQCRSFDKSERGDAWAFVEE